MPVFHKNGKIYKFTSNWASRNTYREDNVVITDKAPSSINAMSLYPRFLESKNNKYTWTYLYLNLRKKEKNCIHKHNKMGITVLTDSLLMTNL